MERMEGPEGREGMEGMEVDVGDGGANDVASGPVPDAVPVADEVSSRADPSPTGGDATTGPLALESDVELLRAELERARTRGVEAYRRALLAENSGRVVPELVGGGTEEEIDRSLEVARRAFEAARAAALAEIASTPVPAGNPVRQEPNVDGMSPVEKIAHGLKRD